MSGIGRKTSWLFGAALAALGTAGGAYAQEDVAGEEDIVVTGTRIVAPGLVSSSPISSISAEEIMRSQQPEVERLIRMMPIAIPGDGQNTNNGSGGTATLNLRGLGPQRNLVMMDGQRMTPVNVTGIVDTQVIPTSLLERIDIITGGASAVYGSDAVSGVVNMVLKRDFEGVELDYDRSMTGEGDGEVNNASILIGGNFADGRGNVAMSLNYGMREAVTLGQRPLGRIGITTATGANYNRFLAGDPPNPAPAGCGGDNVVAIGGGSGTTIPTRLTLGGTALGQFHDDGSIGPFCSQFNFNPYNYYQTPQERFGGAAIGHFELSENIEAYARFMFSKVEVNTQVAPGGLFGEAMWTPMSNPLIGDSARTAILTEADRRRVAGTVMVGGTLDNWRDLNSNGIVDAADDLKLTYARRTVELGPRTRDFGNDWFQMVFGVRGEVADGLHYDVTFSHGEVRGTQDEKGYANLLHVAEQVYSRDGVTCASGTAGCVPINLFGGQGTISPEAADYARASGQLTRTYEQTYGTATISGDVPAVQSPFADSPMAFSLGAEYRQESGTVNPDDCIRLLPDSCLGGRGGPTLPIAGHYDSSELFGEAILPLVRDVPFARSIDMEVGYRYAELNPTGINRSWKYGLTWEPIDGLRFRAMQQRAVRAPNISEIASPVSGANDNADMDPCSRTNAAHIDARLRALCISTGMLPVQVGVIEDFQVGQVSVFNGTDLDALPTPEIADTTTLGFVWRPTLPGPFVNPSITVDYYDIRIDDYINSAPAQGILNGCYVLGDASQCALIHRVGGSLDETGAGIMALTTNLVYLQAEGVEISAAVGVELGALGMLRLSVSNNHYIANEFLASELLEVTNCLGIYSSSCGNNFGTPLPEDRWVQRTTWEFGDFDVSAMWRHLGEVHAENQTIYPAFRTIEAYDYIDLSAGWQLTDSARLMASITNVTDLDPPVVGNEAADTASNSGNTFPATYDPLGQVVTFGFNLRF